MDAPVGDKHCHFDRKEAIERDDQGNTVRNLGEGAGIIWKQTLRSEEMNDVTVKWKALNPVQWGLGLLFIAVAVSRFVWPEKVGEPCEQRVAMRKAAGVGRSENGTSDIRRGAAFPRLRKASFPTRTRDR